MALIITSPAEHFAAAYRPIIYTVFNNSLASPGSNHRMRADIKIGGVVISSTYRYGNSSNVYTFDVSEHLKSMLTGKPEDFKKGTGQFASSDKSIQEYQCVFTELYEDDGLLEEGATATSPTRVVVNATRQHLESQNLLAYTIDGVDQRDLLSNIPDGLKVVEDAYLQLAFINNPDATNITVTVTQFQANGSDIESNYYTLNDSANRRVFQQVMADLDSECDYITIDVGDSAGDDSYANKKTIYVDRGVNKHHTTLFFRNALGGYDLFTFKGVRKNSLATKSQTFTRPLKSSFELSNRGEIITGIEANESFEVYSQLLSKEKMNWLKELLYSVDVYEYDSENPFIGFEVVQSSGFGDTEGWVAFDSSIDIVGSDTMEVITNEGSPSSGGGVSQELEDLEVGKDYLVSVTHVEGTSVTRTIDFTLSAGSLEGVEAQNDIEEGGTTSFIFKPSATTMFLNLRNDGFVGRTNIWNSVSVKRYEIKDKLIPIVIDDGKFVTHQTEEATQLKLTCRYANSINTQSNTDDATVILQS